MSALVATIVSELHERMPAAVTLREQLALALEAHQCQRSIHPFNDGNGRTARLLMNCVQRYHSQPLTVVFCEDRRAYSTALEQSRVADDIGAFFDFMRDQHGKSLVYQLTAANTSDTDTSPIY